MGRDGAVVCDAHGLELGALLGDDGRGRGAAVVEELVERGRHDGDVFFGDAEGGRGRADLGDEVADFVGVEGHESGFGVSAKLGGESGRCLLVDLVLTGAAHVLGKGGVFACLAAAEEDTEVLV